MTRDGTAEPVSRDQIFTRERGQGNVNFPCFQLTTRRIGNLSRLIYNTLQISDHHTYIIHALYCNSYKALHYYR